MKEKSAVWGRKKLILGGIIASLILIISVSACVFALTPSDDKTDKKETTETVVSNDDDTKDTSSGPTSSEEDKPTESKPEESKPEESKPEDASSEQQPATSEPQDTTSKPQETPKQEFSEDEIGRLSDNTERLSKSTIQKIKIDYLKSRAIDDYTQNDIDAIFLEYYATLSDGSMFLYIDSRTPKEGEISICYIEVYRYAYARDLNKIPLIYKNERFEELWSAHRTGLISKDIIDEVLQKFPQIDVSDKCSFPEYNPNDVDVLNLPELSPEEKQQILKERGTHGKELGLDFLYDYVEYCTKPYKETTVKDVGIMSYYGTYNGASVIQMIGPNKSSYCVIEHHAVAGINFSWPAGEGIIVYKNKSFYTLEEAYEKGLLTVEDLKKVQNVLRIIW